MGRSTPKTNEAVPVPKDGPIFWLVSAKTNNGAELIDSVGMKESMELLSRAKETESTDLSPSRELWSILCNAGQIRSQLQALQAYKSNLLNLKKNCETIGHEMELIGTYRILLELSFSNDIPTPLRRAIASNLSTLDSVIEQHARRIREQVIESLFADQHRYWSNALGTLFEMLNYEPTRTVMFQEIALSVKSLEVLVQEATVLQPILDEQSFYQQTNIEGPQTQTGQTAVAAIEKSALIANILKLFLTQVLLFDREETIHLVPKIETLQRFLWSSLSCRGMPADDLNAIGVTYGQSLIFQWKSEESEGTSSSSHLADRAVERVNCITKDSTLPSLNALAAVQGITATLPNEALVQHSPPVFSYPLASYLLEQCRTATGAAVRLSSLRALNTLINRCVAIMATSLLEECHLSYIDELSYGTLEVVLQSWESPPVRQVATAVPRLFRSLLALLGKSGALNGEASSNLQTLVRRILDLPSNRKGKYVALESLLPEVGATFLIDAAGDDLIVSIIDGIGEGGHNVVALSDLLRDLLSRLRLEMNEQAGIISSDERLNKKQRRKRETMIGTRVEDARENLNGKAAEPELPFLTDWVDLWCPHFARALVSGSLSRRNHVSTRCLPLLVDIVGGPTRRNDATHAFSFLLEEVKLLQNQPCAMNDQVESYASEVESLADRVIWASLEIAKHASLQKLLKPPYSSTGLTSAISKSIPPEVLKSSLTHSSEYIRMVSFASIQAIVSTYFSPDAPPLKLLEEEVSYWRFCLPSSSKSGNKAFIKELFQSLSSLLNRISEVESSCLVPDNDGTLPLLASFVCDFLVTDVLLNRTAYPGTVEEKEGFALNLVQCIIGFASQDTPSPSPTQSRGKLQTGSFRTKPRASEVATMRLILTSLLADEPMSTIFSLLHSSWDSTRAISFAYLCQLVELAHSRGLAFPNRFVLPECVRYIQTRYVFLASSPRQREADTGSRVLALVGALCKTVEDRIQHNTGILALLDDRLDVMANVLLGTVPRTVTRGAMESNSSSCLLGDGSNMPMAHGLMMALRLTVESDSILLGKDDAFYQRFAMICCRALQMSLAVVADVTDGATLGGKESLESTSTTRTSTPLNVNTGAIGANAGFSSIEETDEDETLRSLAYQRVVVGSWLMTKEACASLASTITCRDFNPSLDLVGERAGDLLISTLTALKHQGAAFAAHRALQEIVAFCFATLDDSFSNLPRVWARRLIRDISGATSRVRDSTLRRSTGYALAFLSIMRSEPPPSVTPRVLCPEIMASLIRMSLPPAEALEMSVNAEFMETFRLSSPSSSLRPIREPEDTEVCSQERTRVHALNILRLIILDAPLASVSRPFIGKAVMSSMIGYEDTRWAVRNSATMVFSAVMLRVIDADKNANTSSASGNAITATELFRSYPTLVSFLLHIMENGIQKMKLETNTNSPLFPVLLLLSRLQPVAVSGEAAVEITDTFIPAVLQCIGHHQHKIRLVAARALANISTDDSSRMSFVDSLLERCNTLMLIDRKRPDWNTIHGSLLGVLHILSNRLDSGVVLSRVEGLQTSLRRFVDSQSDIFWCPPICTTVALEILCLSSSLMDGGEGDELAQQSLRIVSALSDQRQNAISHDIVGEARLGAVAATVWCKVHVADIWDPIVRDDERRSVLTNLSFLLENDVIDVRLEAIKTVKKSICSDVDLLLSRSDVTRQTQMDVLAEVALVFQGALLAELNSTLSASQTSTNTAHIGMHSPTARRLSRCLLECRYALRALGYVLKLDDMTTESLSARKLWEIGLKMLDLDATFPGDVDRVDTDKRLNGNAVELMAFAIETWAVVDGANSRLASADLRLFVRLLARLVDDQEFWRIRHSVAVAVETSGLLLLDSNDNGVAASQLDLTNTTLTMLQDGDPDVRFVAGRALLRTSYRSGLAAESFSPQLVVERGYRTISARFSDGEMNTYLLQSLVLSCQGIVASLDSVESEFARSDRSGMANELMNLGTNRRKIFENEISNPFEEIAVANQLRSLVLVESGSMLNAEIAGELFASCSSVLRRLLSRVSKSHSDERGPDIAHEMTWSNAVFPFVHSLLVGSITAIYLGNEDSNDVRGDAARIVSLLNSCREKTMHPCVSKAVEVLASSSSHDVGTRKALLECCFLLSSRSDSAPVERR